MVDRCVVCGRELGAGESVTRLVQGKRDSAGEWKEVKLRGEVHDSPCFDKIAITPQSVLSQVKKLAKANSKSK